MQRRGERPDAGKGNSSKTAKGNRHAEGQAEVRRRPIMVAVGVGQQVNTVRGQSGQARKHARDLNTKKERSVSKPGSRNEQRGLPVCRQEPRRGRPYKQKQSLLRLVVKLGCRHVMSQ